MDELKNAREFLRQLVEDYGVMVGVADHENVIPADRDELLESWFICPECGEPIYYEDWGLTEKRCPICMYEF